MYRHDSVPAMAYREQGAGNVKGGGCYDVTDLYGSTGLIGSKSQQDMGRIARLPTSADTAGGWIVHGLVWDFRRQGTHGLVPARAQSIKDTDYSAA